MRPDLVPTLAGMGLTGLRIPDEFGGQGASALLAGIAAEEIGRVDVNASNIIIVTALISDVLVRNGTPEQQARWLPAIADGTSIPCLAVTEPGHTDAATLELKAIEDGDGWLFHGEKTSITLGLYANAGLVLARTGGPGARGVSAFYVNLDDERVTRAGFDDFGGRSNGRASLYLDGGAGDPRRAGRRDRWRFRVGQQGFDFSRAIVGQGCLGTAQAALDETLQWACDRVTFGKPIGTFQGVAFPLAECATHMRGALLVCLETLWMKDNGLEHGAEAAMAKFWAPKLSAEVIHRCLLTFGHLGYARRARWGNASVTSSILISETALSRSPSSSSLGPSWVASSPPDRHPAPRLTAICTPAS